nr:hypothetical protein [Bacteroidota bacterium]
MDRYSVALLLFFKRIKKLIADHIIQQKWLVLPVLFTMALNPLHSQNSLNGDEIEQYRKQAQQLVSFLEFTFNTIGDREVSVNEKDIIINESYAKIFDNEKVQIEDDLDENRQVPINKNVQGYMKDIDFFFHEVSFK